MSTGYNTMGDVWIPTPLVYFEEYPAGGFVSVPRDHIKLLMALKNGGELNGVRILKQETARAMLTDQLQKPITHYGAPKRGERQGLVWWLRNWDQPKQAFHHGGGHMFGWRTMAISWPQYDATIVMAINEWAAASSKATSRPVENFVQSWLSAELPARPALPRDIDNLAWKASYLRGVLFVEGYRYGAGVPEKLSLKEAKRIASESVPQTWIGTQPLWDEDAFVEGVQDMNEVMLSVR
ncbi:serine hydrolase [Pseudomaricurvus alkylphenolicus]|uniref:serine hydrolase n=1 Tax=Pseudomaricurvus alkylphenolicus TaxID=1306991 RepID=UPI00141FFEFE|nr:serine hydrolase [Pseudomaricurvus alkylphenolicus]NIB45182.1 serine hydrolase [Pseudomaricurvus alkylphenolicus]